MSRVSSLLLTGWIVLALAACTSGQEFALPRPGTLVLGKTTPDEVTASVGAPVRRLFNETTERPSSTVPRDVFAAAGEPGRYDAFEYSYGGGVSPMFNAGVRPARVLVCIFWNGKLVAYQASSSYDADSTDFPDADVAKLERGKTTRDEVLTIFGQPSGGAIYPMISRPDGSELAYFYTVENLTAKERHVKSLRIYVDDGGVVREFRAGSETQPIIVQGGGSADIPIFIPKGK